MAYLWIILTIWLVLVTLIMWLFSKRNLSSLAKTEESMISIIDETKSLRSSMATIKKSLSDLVAYQDQRFDSFSLEQRELNGQFLTLEQSNSQVLAQIHCLENDISHIKEVCEQTSQKQAGFGEVLEMLQTKLDSLKVEISAVPAQFDDSINYLSDKNDKLVHQMSKKMEKQFTYVSPIHIRNPFAGMTYLDVMSHEGLQKCQNNALLGACDHRLKIAMGDTAALGMNLIDGISKSINGDMVVSFSKEGRKLLKEGNAVLMKSNGELMPILTGDGNKIIEQSRLVGEGKKALDAVSKITNVVVAAAHIIAGQDVDRQLKEISKKLDFLIQGRRIDQEAKLESIFLYAKQQFSKPLTRQDIALINLKATELKELRGQWHREIVGHLDMMQDPEKLNTWKTWLTRKKKIDQKNYELAQPVYEKMALIHRSLQLEMAISFSTDTGYSFMDSVLGNELTRLKDLDDMLTDRKKVFYSDKGKKGDDEVYANFVEIAQVAHDLFQAYDSQWHSRESYLVLNQGDGAPAELEQ